MAKPSYRLVEIIVAVSVVIISIASLFVAVYQGIVMDRTLKASVLPIIQAGTSNLDPETGEWKLALRVENTGLGPARIGYLNLVRDGEPVGDLNAWLIQCCVPDNIPPAERGAFIAQTVNSGELRFVTSYVQGRFLAPQEQVNLYEIERPNETTQPDGAAIWQAINTARHEVDIEICYCSVFEECWLSRFPQQSREPVRRCEPG